MDDRELGRCVDCWYVFCIRMGITFKPVRFLMLFLLRVFVSRAILGGIMLCLITACNPFRYMAPDSVDIQTREKAKWGDVPAPYPLYCYDTLADKVCYEKPIEKEKERLMGYYGPPPRQHGGIAE